MSQNTYRLNNLFDAKTYSPVYVQNRSNKKFDVPVKFKNTLKGYIVNLSDNKDTMYIKFWYFKHKAKTDTTDPSVISKKNVDSTFAYPIKWNEENHHSVRFNAWAVNATTIPFRYRLKKNADLEANFLSAGVNISKIYGKTRFYKHDQISPRQYYGGVGFFLGFSQQKLDSANTRGNVKAEHMVAILNYGISYVYSWNNFNVSVAVGADNGFGGSAHYWEDNNFKYGFRPWIGFGFGFKLLGLEFSPTNKKD